VQQLSCLTQLTHLFWTAESELSSVDELQQLSLLQTLKLRRLSAVPRDVHNFKFVQSLSLHGIEEQVCSIESYTQLTHLQIRINHPDTVKEIILPFGDDVKPRSLELWGPARLHFFHLRNLTLATRLEEISLYSASPQSIEQANLSALPFLTEVQLMEPDFALVQTLSLCSSLQKLREQQIANAASSSFFSPTVVRPAAKPVASNLPAVPPASSLPEAPTRQAEGNRAAELANAAASAFFAPAQLRHVHSQQHGQMPVPKTAPSHRASPPLHCNPPTATAAAKPQFTRATRGSFEQPQTRARGSFEQPQTRARGSFEQAQTRARGSFEQPQTGARGSFEHAHSRARNSFEQSQPRCRNSFEEAHNVAGNSPQATGRSSFDQLQARSSYDQLHTRHSQSALGAISEHPSMHSAMPPAHQMRHLSAFGQGPGQANYAPGVTMDHFANSQPNSAGFRHPTARASCDYPHAVANARASASAPRAQALYTAQLDRSASSGSPVSRQCLVASRELARLDEATKRQAAIAALGARPFPPHQMWPEQGANVNARNAVGSPFGQWSAQPAADLPSYQPHALQLHALNTLHAMNISAQSPQGQPSFWSQKQHQPHGQTGHSGFPATNEFPTISNLPSTPPSTATQWRGNSASSPFPKWSPSGSHYSQHSLQKNGGSPSRPALTEVGGVNASDLQGTWGAHLDSGANTPTPRNSGSARGQSYNPFLQPQSTFSIREAKLQLQNPTPRDAGKLLSALI